MSHTELKSRKQQNNIAHMWTLKKRYKRTYYQSRNAVTDVKHELMVTGESGGGDNSGAWD